MYKPIQITLLSLFIFLSSVVHAATIYVDAGATGTNAGSSWANAYVALQDAINASSPQDHIWIAEGTYKPTLRSTGTAGTTTAEMRDQSFYGLLAIKLYGGFAGTETLLSERNSSANPVILSGNIGNLNDNTDNCYHVIIISGSNATIDGLTITGGYADGTGNLNSVDRNKGGAIYQRNSGDIALNDVTITGNYASDKGGGIYGGDNGADIQLANSVISSNSATNGGGVFTTRGGYNWSNVVFYQNTASTGGALTTVGGLNIKQILFLNNSATTNGGAIYTSRAGMTLLNCNFIFNSAAVIGGGIYYYSGASSQTTALKNTVFFGNMQSSTSTRSTTGADIYYLNSAPITVTNSIMQLASGSYSSNNHNQISHSSSAFNVFPDFADTTNLVGADGIWMTQDDGLLFYRSSPAYAAGTSSGVSSSSTDITGAVWGSPPSIGAYKGYAYNLYFVKTTGNNSNAGTSWATAKNDLQNAIDVAISGDEIWIAAGTYKPTKIPGSTGNSTSRDVAFHINKNLKIYGGFAGTETSLSQRNISENPVTLSGDIGTIGTNTDNCYHVVITKGLNNTSLIDGLTIRDGYSSSSGNISWSGNGTYYRENGAGMVNYQSAVILNNLIICNNTSVHSTKGKGGGLYNDQANIKVYNSVIYSNISSQQGGGVYNTTSNSKFYNTTFYENIGSNGGAMFNNNNSPIVNNCIFWKNKKGTSISSAGSDISGGTPTVIYCITQNNSNFSSGTGIVNNQSPLFTNASDPDGADNVWMTKDDGLKLKSTSPAVDAGLNSVISGYSTDILGTTRVMNTTVNMGAYEMLGCQQGNTLPTAAGTYTATYSDIEGSYTCYCDDNQNLILALDLNSTGAVVPSSGVSLEIGATTTTSWSTAGGIITNANGGAIINRKWDVAPTTQPTSDVTVIYPFTHTEYSAAVTALGVLGSTITNANQLEMYKLTSAGTFADPHASGATGALVTHGSSASTSNWVWSQHGNGTDHLATYKVSSFSGGGGGGGASGSPLPVELIHFDAQAAANHTADLHWVTASEINNSHFEIERSYDGRTFETVGNVTGNGTTSHLIDYNYTDWSIAKSQNTAYYRLKQ
ncbi:hypothetical protein N9772_07470, partial [Bacteroidia bacterium]|nr:hypothetical protein [Bacteroidia bacterium]